MLSKVKKAATVTVAAIIKRKCTICDVQLGVLHCDNNKWICEDCAQVMSDSSQDELISKI